MTTDRDLTLILPVYNEQECVEATVREAHAVLRSACSLFEILAMDDGSDDGTRGILASLAREIEELRVLTIVPHSGQGIATGAGIREARGRIVVLMDADGQNDPADISRMLEALDGNDACFGYRASRRDRPARVLAGKIANAVRNGVLGEKIIDSGCTLKAIRAEFLDDWPAWHGMHRFIGSFVAMRGARIVQIPVNHRARSAGTSKYTNLGRLLVTVQDLLGVRWMGRRFRRFRVEQA